tara:strand:+ start:5034 stop:5552 length:519 start_codon:yes stop_codon:yes gene_type:complete
MAIFYKNFRRGFINSAPLLLLYFLSITELDTEFSNYFEILSFNLQLIVIYYWYLKIPSILGNVHIFTAGIINDIIMGLPMGISSLGYLTTALVAIYVRNVTLKMTLFTDWFTFVIAIFFSNLTYLILINNFSEINIHYSNLFYNSLFTFLFFPVFWFLFNSYQFVTNLGKDD